MNGIDNKNFPDIGLEIIENAYSEKDAYGLEKTFLNVFNSNQSFRNKVAKVAAKELSLFMAQTKISQREAYRRFGKSCVKRWVSQGLVTFSEEGNRHYYDQKVLMLLAQKEA